MLNRIREILPRFGIHNVGNIEQIHKNAWSIGDAYILKHNSNISEFEKSIKLCNILTNENIPVAQYHMTKDRRSYVYSDGKDYYCLMSKLPGRHIDPFIGDCIKNGRKLGNIVATLHMALKKIESPFEYYDADIIMELKGWIAHEIKESNLNISQEIIDTCYEFEKLYSRLPRQLIHRDIHTGNLLFEDDSFIGYLDFDISQRNVRIFDICYLGAGLLVENYLEAERLCQWQEIFGGILEGYEEMSELSSDERQAIPMMFIIIELIFAAYFSKIGQVEVSKSCINMINWLYDNLDRIEDVINAR